MINTGNRALRGGYGFSIAKQLVLVQDSGALGGQDMGPQRERVSDTAWTKILTRNRRDNQTEPLLLELGITVSDLAHEFSTSKFEIVEIVGVVNVALSIRLVIANTDLNLMLCNHGNRNGRKLVICLKCPMCEPPAEAFHSRSPRRAVCSSSMVLPWYFVAGCPGAFRGL